MIISIDFDGTIVRGEFPEIDGLIPYAKEMVQRLRSDGHYIIINTCRSDDQAIDAVNYLLDAGISFDRFNDNAPSNTEKHNSNSRKIYADIYIDDRQVGGLPPWTTIYEMIQEHINTHK